MFKRHPKLTALFTVLLIVGLIASGLTINIIPASAQENPKINPELTKYKTNLDENGLIFITNDDSIPSQNMIEYNHENVSTKITKLNKKNISQLNIDKFKNIAVNTNQLTDQNTAEKIREAYNSGSRIILQKDNITPEEAYGFLGIQMPEYFEGGQAGDDKLTSVAISILKDSEGIERISTLTVESNIPSEVLRVITIACRDDKDTFKYFFSKNINSTANLISSKPVYASIDTSWPRMAIFSRYDSWESVDINWVFAKYRDPSNPVNSQYVFMSDAGVTATTRLAYGIGTVYIYQSNNSGGKVAYYKPTPITSQSSYSASFGFPPSSSIGINFNRSTSITTTGTSGTNYTQWAFSPIVAGFFVPTTFGQTYNEGANQYIQSGSSCSVYFKYSVDMWSGDLFIVSTASSSYSL
ncbi:MAG: hypothetical protein AB7E31_01290 [Desulfitobacterium sp.]